MATQLWLMKSEPDVYSIADLEAKGTGIWEGVRNYQARNYLREMELGDLAFFYHSNAKPTGIAGLLRVTRTAYVDPFQLDPKSEYYDPKSKKEDPRWSMVDVGFVERFAEVVSLEQMKGDDALQGMRILEKGTRLSVTPVERAHFAHVLKLAKAKTRLPKT